MWKLGLLAERGRGWPKYDLECEVYQSVIEGHNVHDDDFQLDIEGEVQEKMEEIDNTKYKIEGPIPLLN